MIRSIGFLLFILLMAGPEVRAQTDNPKPDKPEPPVRLKKKNQPNQDSDQKKQLKEEKKTDELKEEKNKKKNDGDEPAPTEPEEDPKLIIGRISKNMDSSKDRLAQKDPGDGTQQIQRDIVRDLDSLIEQSKRQQQQQQQNQQQSGQSSSSRQRSGQQRGGQQARERKSTGQQKQQASGQSQAQGSQPQQQVSGQNPGGGGSGGKKSTIPNADLYKDIWGHLPELARMNLDAYSRVEFMSKYNDLLKQYYTTLAEKGRKKGDGQ